MKDKELPRSVPRFSVGMQLLALQRLVLGWECAVNELNRPLRSGREGHEEEIFGFRWKDAEAKRLAAYRRC